MWIEKQIFAIIDEH